jgi:5-oxoprolinase (ATP-hydrolysing) subunit A
MAVSVIDLNADLGEGVTDDDGLLAVVTSANVACGFHAGDASTMRRVCEGAAERGVVVGAQVSYRDRAGFGRRDIEVLPSQLTDDVVEQIAQLSGHASAVGINVAYVKPHGALYNRAVWDEERARAVVAAVVHGGRLPVLGLPGSQLLALAREHGLPAVAEAFADRAYTVGGALVPRESDGAVLTDAEAVAARAVQIATTGRVDSIDGRLVRTPARSICVHGDTPGAVAIARRVRAALASAGVAVRAFA